MKTVDAYELAQKDLSTYKQIVKHDYDRLPHLDLLDAHLMACTMYLESGGQKGINRLIIEMPPRHGKCVAENTLVTMVDGSRKFIQNIYPSDMVKSLTECYNSTVSKVTGTHNNGVKPVIEITLFSGRKIVCTKNHPLLTIHGWKDSGELAIDDAIAVHRYGIAPDAPNLEYGLASLLGYIVGDGTFTESIGTIGFSCADSAVMVEIDDIMSHHGWQVTKRAGDNYDYYLSNANHHTIDNYDNPTSWVGRYMERGTSHTKRVPDCIFTANLGDAAKFLGAYFNCDGNVNGKREGVAEFYSVNKDLLSDVQELLHRFGIYSSLRLKNGRYKGENHVSYRLIVSGGDFVRFADNIPVIGEKGDKLQRVADKVRGNNHYPEYDSIPNGWQEYLTIGKGTLRLQHGIRVDKKYKRGTARHIIKQIADIDDNEKLRQLCADDIIWERIVEIKEVGDKPTFDIEVENTHNYSVHGIVSHNTLTTSQLYPTWHLGRNPNHNVMLVSYGATLAHDNSRASRNLIRDEYYSAMFPNTKLSNDRQAVDTWKVNAHEGGVNALGITGGATGKGAHILIIDDPVKSRAEAESQVYRDRTWSAFTSDLYTRLAPNGVIIIMATRWHMDDLTGRALQLDEDWVRLRLPALAEENDPLGRDVGQALWQDRYDEEYLAKVKQTLGEYEFSSLYQQNPMPSKAGLFDVSKITIVDSVPDNLRKMRFYDMAVTAKKTSDYTAGGLVGVDNAGNAYILHMYRVQKTPIHVKADIVQNAMLDGVTVPIRLEAENAGRVQLDYLLQDPDLRRYTIDAVTPKGDKYTRAQPFASRVNAEKVFMLRGDWNRALLDEMAVFPMGAHDDQVDTLSGAWGGISNTLDLSQIEFLY